LELRAGTDVTIDSSGIISSIDTGTAYAIDNRLNFEFISAPTGEIEGIVNRVEPTATPSVSKIIIDNEYKDMTFTYETGATNTLYTVTFNEDTECNIVMVAGGGGGSQAHGGGGGAETVVFIKNVNMNGVYNIAVGKGGLVTSTPNGLNGVGLKGNDTSIIQLSNQIIAEGGGGAVGKNSTNGDGQDGGSGGGGDAYTLNAGQSKWLGTICAVQIEYMFLRKQIITITPHRL